MDIYTLLDLRNLCIALYNKPIIDIVYKILRECRADDGGIYPMAKKAMSPSIVYF